MLTTRFWFEPVRVLLLATFVLALLSPVPAAVAELARVQRVLDGDSVRLADGREIRLIGINTPEFDKDGAAHQPLAETARRRTAALLEGKSVRIVYDSERFDRHERTLAYLILLDGRDVQEVLLREGMAWFVAIPPNTARLGLYREAESAARAARLGVWAGNAYQPVPAEKLRSRHTGFLRTSGTVVRVTTYRRSLSLYLTERVVLTLPRKLFQQDGDSFVGRQVLARGWMTEYKNGLRMRVTHPAMLEVVQ